MATVKGKLVLFVFFVLSFMQNAAGRCLLVEADSNKSSPAGSLHLDVRPSQITPGLTDSLSLNCTFSSSQDSGVYTIMSLIVYKSVYKENQQEIQEDQYIDLVSLNIFSPDQVNELNEVNGSVTGHIDSSGDSYLMITWSYPTSDQGGKFKCEVHGMSSAGHSVEMFQTCVVTSQQPNFDQIINKVSELQKLLDRQENLARNQSDVNTMLQSQLDRQENIARNQSEAINTLVSLSKSQLGIISTQADTIKSLESKLDLSILLQVYNSAKFRDHYYVLSGHHKMNATDATKTCKDYGGYLVKIDDDTEYQFVKKFVGQYSDVTHVLISGTDEGHEGRWTYLGTNTDLSFTAWQTGRPLTSQPYNCLGMYRGYQWRWYGESCSSTRELHL